VEAPDPGERLIEELGVKSVGVLADGPRPPIHDEEDSEGVGVGFEVEVELCDVCLLREDGPLHVGHGFNLHDHSVPTAPTHDDHVVEPPRHGDL